MVGLVGLGKLSDSYDYGESRSVFDVSALEQEGVRVILQHVIFSCEVLVDYLRLSSHVCLVELESLGLDQYHVGGDLLAVLDFDDVSDDQLVRVDFFGLSVSDDA